jgi:diguanylate cyclase
LSKRVEVLQQSLERSQEEASMDSLTRVANRGSFDRALARWTAVHNDSKKSFVLALFDLDNFKAINDANGHLIGDRVLLCAAQWFSKAVRANDFLARYGGEEFVVMLSNLTVDQAEKKFSELLARIAASSYDYKIGETYSTISFTVSCGISEFTPGATSEEVVKRADEALYEAKRTGKNRVVISKSKKSKGLWNAFSSSSLFGAGSSR